LSEVTQGVAVERAGGSPGLVASRAICLSSSS
jgi:hypothetical protein